MKMNAILFDCDGVLVDSEPITNGVLRDMLVEIGGQSDSGLGWMLPVSWAWTGKARPDWFCASCSRSMHTFIHRRCGRFCRGCMKQAGRRCGRAPG